MAGEEAYLRKAIDRYAPAIAALGRTGLAALRQRFPGARIQVYERRTSLVMGLAPAKGSALFSLVLYPRWVRFFFLEGVALDDPEGRLEGTGSQVRSIRVDDGARFDDPYVRRLMAQAVAGASADLTSGRGAVELRSRLDMTPPPAFRRRGSVNPRPRGRRR